MTFVILEYDTTFGLDPQLFQINQNISEHKGVLEFSNGTHILDMIHIPITIKIFLNILMGLLVCTRLTPKINEGEINRKEIKRVFIYARDTFSQSDLQLDHILSKKGLKIMERTFFSLHFYGGNFQTCSCRRQGSYPQPYLNKIEIFQSMWELRRVQAVSQQNT